MDDENIEQDHRIRLARELILRKKDITLQQLFKLVPRKIIAQAIGLNVVSFTNVRSKHPGGFRVNELVLFAKAFDLSLCAVVDLFARSISDTDNL